MFKPVIPFFDKWAAAGYQLIMSEFMGTMRKRREDLGLSQAEFAKKMRVGVATAWRWEHGDVIPQPRFWSRLERVLQAPIGELIGIAQRKPPKAA